MLSKGTILYSTIIAILYGLMAQLVIRFEYFKDLFLIISFGFVFIFPLSMGFVTIYLMKSKHQKSIFYQIFLPWAPTVLNMFLSMLIGWEGTICLIMALPIYLFFSSLGGIIAGIWIRFTNTPKLSFFSLAGFLIAPFLIGYTESFYELPNETRIVNTQITILSTEKEVWNNITKIPKITEDQNSFFYWMGFPKPVEATLSHEGIGGVREASFEKGLVFYETINVWEQNKKLSFLIKADPSSTPITTLDEHVVVGGRYFDALKGTYEIERISDDKIILHLSSEYRLSTQFNIYASNWSDFLMKDIQENILKVIKTRSEKKSG
jgi:hypothetical protein